MDEEERLKDEVRLWALESLVAMLFASCHKATGNPDQSLAELEAKLMAKAKNQAFPELQPEFSDHVSAEFEAALQRLIGLQREWMHPQG